LHIIDQDGIHAFCITKLLHQSLRKTSTKELVFPAKRVSESYE